MRHLRHVSSLTAIGAALLLTACGDGGGGSAGPAYDGPTAAVGITMANADSIAAQSSGYAQADPGSLDVPDPTALDSLIMQSAAGVLPKEVGGYVKEAFAAQKTRMASVGVRTKDSYEEPCDTGRMQITENDADGNPATSSSGDSMTVGFDSCEMIFGDSSTVMTGSINMTFASVTGNYPWGDYTVSLAYSADEVKVAQKSAGSLTGNYVLMHGGYQMDFAVNGVLTTAHMTSPSMLVEAMQDGEKMQIFMTGVDQRFSLDSNTMQLTFGNDLTIASTQLGGAVTIDTTQDFVLNSGASYPSSGTMVITGANGANVTLTANSDGQHVTIDYDLEVPFGTPDGVSKTVTWDELATL